MFRHSIPLILCTALAAGAATITGPGVCYDVGKGSFSQDPAARGTADTVLCWAASASNLIQYWQDSHYKGHAAPGTPNGLNGTTYGKPAGTRYLQVYEKFLQESAQDEGGGQALAFDWWFMDKHTEELKDARKAYYPGFSSPAYTADYLFENPTLEKFRKDLEQAFAVQGQAAGLNIWQICRTEKPGTFPSKTRFHAITCWGYETDAAGRLTALFLADSDDCAYGVFKVHVATRTTADPFTGRRFASITLYTDDDIDGYSPGEYEPNLHSLAAISTPKDMAKPAAAPNAAPAKADRVNTALTGSISAAAPIQVGNGRDLVIFSADTLKLKSAKGDSPALSVAAGSLASISALSGGGKCSVQNHGRLCLHHGDVKLKGLQNHGYLEIMQGGSVALTGVANAGRMALHGCKSAVLKGSLRNSGTLLICGKSPAAFRDTTLDSTGGTVILGQDSAGASPTTITFTAADGKSCSITSSAKAPAVLKDVTISATEIRGTSPAACIRNATISGNPQISGVKVD